MASLNLQSGQSKGGGAHRAPLLEPIIDEDKEDKDESEEDKAAAGAAAAAVESGLSPADTLAVPSRVREGLDSVHCGIAYYVN